MIEQELINTGLVPNDGTGDTIRVSFQKTNNNFTEIYSAIANSDAIISDLVANAGFVVANQAYSVVNTSYVVTNSS